MKKWVLLLVAVGACAGDADPPWQLDHDRIVAVRATPSHLAPGEQATLDALVAHTGADTSVEVPAGVIAVSPPPALTGVVRADGSIVAPDDATLAAARAQLKLAADAPVPLELGMQFGSAVGVGAGGQPLTATKTLWLGAHADNPAMPAITIDGKAPAETLVFAYDTDVPLAVDADPAWKIYWLTSCGTMHDDDEHAAFVHVEKDDALDGELAVVIRDASGGVAWQTWPAKSTPPPATK